MLTLCTKGVEDLAKVKNRVARLYGAGRISQDDFQRLNDKITKLHEDLKTVKEVDMQ